MARAVLAGMPGTPSSSSWLAARKRSAEPKCCSSARRRTGPTPGSVSKLDSRAVEPAHAELAVVRLLRHRVLEDDHRADGRLALDVRDVVALDPQRQALEVQRLAQLLERLDPPQPAPFRLQRLRLERQPRVLGR